VKIDKINVESLLNEGTDDLIFGMLKVILAFTKKELFPIIPDPTPSLDELQKMLQSLDFEIFKEKCLNKL
jgi:hypothetical protein